MRSSEGNQDQKRREREKVSFTQAKAGEEVNASEGPLGTVTCEDVKGMKDRPWWDWTDERGKVRK